MADSEIGVRLRLRDARRFQSDARASAGSLDAFGTSADRAAAKSGVLSRAAGGARSALGSMGRVAKTAGLGLAGIGVTAATMGVKFNAGMEQNQVAFANFLGSTDKARVYLDDLYKLAANTPFEFPQLTDAAQKFLAFGFTASETKDTLATVGDTIAGLGGGAEEMDRLTMSLGQIQAKGKLSTEEVLQIAELGVPAFKILRDQFDLTGTELEKKLRDGAIGADDAIAALTAGMDQRFKGASKAQAKTLAGQWSTLKDNANQTLGLVFAPLSDSLRKDVLPLTNRLVGAFGRGFKRDGLEGGIAAIDRASGASGKLVYWFDRVRTFATRAWDQFKRWRGSGGPGRSFEQLKDAVRPLAPLIDGVQSAAGNPNVRKAAAAAVALGVGFKVANAATGGLIGGMGRTGLESLKLTTATVGLVTQIIAFRTARLTATGAENAGAAASLRQRAATIASSTATKIAAATTWLFNAALAANPIVLVIAGIALLIGAFVLAYKKIDWFRAGVDAVWKWLKTAAGDAVHWVVARFGDLIGFFSSLPGKISRAASGLWDVLKDSFRGALNWLIGAWNSFQITLNIPDKIPGLPDQWVLSTPDLPLLAAGGIATAPGMAVVGERGPELLSMPRGARVDPLPPVQMPAWDAGGEVVIHNHLHIDGEVAARATLRAAAARKARA